jgi:hypothetical protein
MLLILARDALSYARGAIPIDDCPAAKQHESHPSVITGALGAANQRPGSRALSSDR